MVYDVRILCTLTTCGAESGAVVSAGSVPEQHAQFPVGPLMTSLIAYFHDFPVSMIIDPTDGTYASTKMDAVAAELALARATGLSGWSLGPPMVMRSDYDPTSPTGWDDIDPKELHERTILAWELQYDGDGYGPKTPIFGGCSDLHAVDPDLQATLSMFPGIMVSFGPAEVPA